VTLLTAVGYALIWPKQDRLEALLGLAAFSMLGLVAGYLTGFSRTSTVGAVLPAALSLVAGLAVFMMGRDKSVRVLVSLVALFFSASLVIGTTWGSAMRSAYEDYRTSADFRKLEALAEDDVREFRNNLGLPPERLPAKPGDTKE
jgi:hypothetical protein